jgi:hypothetical protein
MCRSRGNEASCPAIGGGAGERQSGNLGRKKAQGRRVEGRRQKAEGKDAEGKGKKGGKQALLLCLFAFSLLPSAFYLFPLHIFRQAEAPA